MRVRDERDEDRREAEPEKFHENRQQRETGNGVERAQQAEHPTREMRAARGIHAERNGDDERDRERGGDDLDVRGRQQREFARMRERVAHANRQRFAIVSRTCR